MSRTSTTNAEVFDEGYSAHVNGYDITDNPYFMFDDRFLVWVSGYKQSEEELGGEDIIWNI